MFKRIVRVSVPVAAFGFGCVAVTQLKYFEKQQSEPHHYNKDAIAKITSSPQYLECTKQKGQILNYGSHGIPPEHRSNFIATGLLSGPNLFGIDPILFTNHDEKSLTGFYHLGSEMISHDGQIHNGAILTILDGELCKCGFPQIPSKRGVTASLEINFHNQAEPNSLAMLKARVVYAKGRKAVVEGTLYQLPYKTINDYITWEHPVVIATSRCILVEPRWFKWVAWMWKLNI